jgi:ADP-L-glycero-D-manno-heptose 6-epimerase
LAKAVFHALNKPVDIEYVDTPADIRDKYHYFTEAKMGKLTEINYPNAFSDIERGIIDYLKLISL